MHAVLYIHAQGVRQYERICMIVGLLKINEVISFDNMPATHTVYRLTLTWMHVTQARPTRAAPMQADRMHTVRN